MNYKIENLKNFIQEYGEDFLEDGTKSEVIQALSQGNAQLALEILNSMEKQWLQRVKEIKRFLIFTDYTKGNSNREYYRMDYIDSLELEQNYIPVLRKVIQREYGKNRFYIDKFER